MRSIDKPGRRWHSKTFKDEAVAACRESGVSLASVALERQVNANLLRRWVKDAEAKSAAARTIDAVRSEPVPAFVPMKIAPPRDGPGKEPPIRVSVRKRGARITIEWPASAASSCALWLRELLG
jgi:transposase